MCPYCGRDAPIVYRGVVPYCTACGGLRAPLSTPSINMAGKTSRVGGTVASVAGWLVLLVGFSIALGLGLLLWAIFSGAIAAAVSLPFALVAGVIGFVLLRGGSSLRRTGADAERATRDQALLAMAGHHGPVTAVDAARLLNVTVASADAMLTELAKREPERVAIDVDDQGVVWYRLARPFDVAPALDGRDGRVRVGGAGHEPGGDALSADEDDVAEGQVRR
jgi:hypothetical protein